MRVCVSAIFLFIQELALEAVISIYFTLSCSSFRTYLDQESLGSSRESMQMGDRALKAVPLVYSEVWYRNALTIIMCFHV